MAAKAELSSQFVLQL
uniref:Uncharacterized protein n=1 Tax=Rhizophora mucronata TaxID=61149 RepID=A0A2P2NSK0_RHIMU